MGCVWGGDIYFKKPFYICKHMCLQYLGYLGDRDDAGSGEITRGIGQGAG